MAQPFALENLASKVGLSQKRAQQDYFDARAREGTNLLEKELDRMQKEASKRTGLFGGKFGGLAKTALGMVNPVLGLLAGGLDTVTSQQDLKKMIKKALFYGKKLDINRGMGYINEEFRNLYKYKDGNAHSIRKRIQKIKSIRRTQSQMDINSDDPGADIGMSTGNSTGGGY